MLRSMYTGVSGLRTHQLKMDVIGNNIANVNTVGFKKGKVTFQEVFYQTLKGASGGQGGKGGTNPQQVGLGVDVGAISTVHTQGPAQRTDDGLDIMINGDGFFVVSDDPNFLNRYFTRAGNFQFDGDGYLTTAEGLKVLGYTADDNGNISSQIGDIRIDKTDTVPPQASTKINFGGNLKASTEIDKPFKMDTDIFDSLGNKYTVEFNVTKKVAEDDGNTWNVSISGIKDSNGNIVEGSDGINFDQEISFDKDGKITGTTDASFNIGDIIKGANIGDNGEIKIDFSGLTQYGAEMDAKPYRGDGYGSGKVDGVAIDPKGVVEVVYTNGERKAIGQIVLAKFDNNPGLEKIGGNLFRDTRNSGEPNIVGAGSGGTGSTDAGRLEMSNVDLSQEFTEMITTQRGFQANSRIITTSDEMLQELVNLKR